MDERARERQQVMTGYGVIGAFGWLAGSIYLWFAGLAGSDGGAFFQFLLIGGFASLLLVGAVAYTISGGVRRASGPLRVSPSVTSAVGVFLVGLAFLAGVGLAIALRGLAY